MKEPAAPTIDPERLADAVTRAGLPGGDGRFDATYLGRFSNDVWRLDLRNGIRLIAKAPYRPERPHEHPDVERAFYRTIGRRPDLPVPGFVAELDGILLLIFEALRPFDFRTGVRADHAERAIQALAAWHAAWWQRPPEVDWLPRLDDPEYLAAAEAAYNRAWSARGASLCEAAPEFRPIGDALVGHLASTLAPMAEPATLLHGDAHAENLPLTGDGRVLLLDWQEPRIGNPGYDLAVFTTMSFRHADRPDAEQALLRSYLHGLDAAGCDWPDPHLGYRLGILRRIARLVEISDLNLSSMPWMFRRTALAALAHDVGALVI